MHGQVFFSVLRDQIENPMVEIVRRVQLSRSGYFVSGKMLKNWVFFQWFRDSIMKNHFGKPWKKQQKYKFRNGRRRSSVTRMRTLISYTTIAGQPILCLTQIELKINLTKWLGLPARLVNICSTAPMMLVRHQHAQRSLRRPPAVHGRI